MTARSRREVAIHDFDRFAERCTPGLLRTGYLIIWDLGLVEDLVQECLVRVARRWPKVSRMEYPEAYARRILVNLALDGRRRAGDDVARTDRSGALPEQIEDPRSRAQFARAEDQPDLLPRLLALAPRQRAVLVLRYFEDLSEAQTAKVMGCSVGTVKSTTAKALDRLRADWPDGPAEGPDLRNRAGFPTRADHRSRSDFPTRSDLSTRPALTSKGAQQ